MINVAIVGTGGISHAHIKAYLQFPDRCRIVALVDIIPGKAQKVKEQYGLDAEVYLDHHDILGRDDIDLVDVCTPPFAHAEVTINALKSGKNAVCLLRPVVAGHLGEGRRRMHAEPRGAPYRHAGLDDGHAGEDDQCAGQHRP